jgi:hypothetical protein
MLGRFRLRLEVSQEAFAIFGDGFDLPQRVAYDIDAIVEFCDRGGDLLAAVLGKVLFWRVFDCCCSLQNFIYPVTSSLMQQAPNRGPTPRFRLTRLLLFHVSVRRPFVRILRRSRMQYNRSGTGNCRGSRENGAGTRPRRRGRKLRSGFRHQCRRRRFTV